MLESMLPVRDLLGSIALVNESLLLSDVDWFAAQKLTECLKLVFDTTTAIQQNKLSDGEWLKCKVRLEHKGVNNASFLTLTLLHAIERRETTLLPNFAFLAANYVDPRYQVLLKYCQKTVVQSHLAALWRHLQKLQKSVDTTDIECLNSFSESENKSTSACGVDIFNEILSTSDAFSAISSITTG